MTRPLEEIARQIGNRPLESCISMPFANGDRATVWGDRITPADYARLREMFAPKLATNLTHGQWRSIHEADEAAEGRRRRRR